MKLQKLKLNLISSDFRSARSAIERVFGLLKSSYKSVGTGRFRSRRHIGPILCNVTAAMQNRRKLIFKLMRERLHDHFM